MYTTMDLELGLYMLHVPSITLFLGFPCMHSDMSCVREGKDRGCKTPTSEGVTWVHLEFASTESSYEYIQISIF